MIMFLTLPGLPPRPDYHLPQKTELAALTIQFMSEQLLQPLSEPEEFGAPHRRVAQIVPLKRVLRVAGSVGQEDRIA